MTSTIPSEIGRLEELSQLLFGGPGVSGFPINHFTNQLTGRIVPSEIGQWTELAFLDFSDNRLTGSIPTLIGRLTQLFEVSFFNNQMPLLFRQYFCLY